MYSNIKEGLGLHSFSNKSTAPSSKMEAQESEPESSGLFLAATKHGDFSGSDNLAAVHRAEWDDYLSRFAPTEDLLFDIFNDEEGRQQAVEEAGANAGTAIDRSKQQADMSLSRYGVNLSEDKAQKRDRKYALDKTLAVAGAKNMQRDENEKQKMSVMAGSSATTKSNLGG